MANYTLDIKKPSRQFIIEGLHLGDNGFRDFKFHFTDGPHSFPLPEGSIVTLFAALPNGSTVYDSCTLCDDGSVLYTLKGGSDRSSITSCAGVCDCELRVTSSGGKVLTSPRFAFFIENILQSDSAIESQSSFSALTDALSRVLEAENGLFSKADKVKGKVGNTAVIGEGGNLSDSGILPATVYNFNYFLDGSYNEYNRSNCEKLLGSFDGHLPFCVTVSTDDEILPATAEIGADGTVSIYALCKDGTHYLKIRVTDTVTLYDTVDILSSSFDEKGSGAANQKATADWVKAYVDESIVEGAW